MSFNLYHNLPELARNGGFTLCEVSGENDLDWRFIASVDTTRIIRESDFEKLDQCIPFLIQSSVGNLLNVRILDPAIARIYIISQLSLQYLRFCVKFLDKSVYSLRENIFNDQKKTLKLEETLEKRDEEIAQLQKKLKRQDVLNQPIFPCTKCTKNFLSAALLSNHISRKHPLAQVQESKDKDSNLINTIKLELEIKQLKEKLNSTEKDLMELKEKAVSATCVKCLKDSQRMFQSVAVQSNFEEKEKNDIEKDAICELLNNQMKHFEEWKGNEETRYHLEISELRAKLDDTIETLKLVAVQKESRAPSPAPRLLRHSDKGIGTSKSVESIIAEPRTDETVWKARYEELEKMYEEHQRRMAFTVTSIEKAYTEKMSNIEETVNQLKEERLKVHDELKKQAEKPAVPLSPKVIETVHQYSSSSDTEEEIQVQPQIVKPLHSQPSQNFHEKPIFAAQKFFIRKKDQKPHKAESTTTKANLEQTVMLFAKRLEEHGISPDQTRISKSEFGKVHSQMVSAREKKPKKHKSFSLTRRKLISTVEKIFRPKCDTSKNEKEEEPKPIQPVDRKKSSINLPVKSLANDQLFRDDLDRMLKSNLQHSSSNNKENIDHPKNSKKKVLFDLKEEDDSDFDLSSFTSEIEEDETNFVEKNN